MQFLDFPEIFLISLESMLYSCGNSQIKYTEWSNDNEVPLHLGFRETILNIQYLSLNEIFKKYWVKEHLKIYKKNKEKNAICEKLYIESDCRT